MRRKGMNVFTLLLCLILSACDLSYYSNNKTSDNSSVNNGEGLSKNQKLSYYEGSYSKDNDYENHTPYGIGRSINALTDNYIQVTNGGNQIFDINKLTQLKWTKTKLRQQEAQIITEDSTKKFQETLTVGYGRKFSAEADVNGVFTAGLEKAFDISNTFHFNKNTHEIISRLYQNINGFSIEIEGYRDPRNFRDLLSSKLLDDLANIENGSLTTEEFFQYYGTHVVMAGYYGGRIECNYRLVFDDSEVSDSLMSTYKSKASAALKNMQSSASASKETSFNIKNEISYDIESRAESFTFYGKGGKYLTGFTQKDFMEGYSSWVESFNEDEEGYSVLVDVPDNSLVPIWSLFPEENSNAANIVYNAFLKKADECQNIWIEKSTPIYDCVEDFTNFSGGDGSEFSPYLISKPEQMRNIEKFMDAHYKLQNDISLKGYSNWESIGGYYRKTEFNGVFDGNSKTIKDLQRTADVPEISDRSFYGLFGKIGSKGEIKNVIFEDVNLKFTGPNVENGNARCFFGVVAGECDGTIRDVTVEGYLSYNLYTDGESYLGGICGYLYEGEIYNCINNVEIFGCRYSVAAGGLIGYAYDGKAYNCINKGLIKTKGCWGFSGGFSYSSGICPVTSETNKLDIYNFINSGEIIAEQEEDFFSNNNDIANKEGFCKYKTKTY